MLFLPMKKTKLLLNFFISTSYFYDIENFINKNNSLILGFKSSDSSQAFVNIEKFSLRKIIKTE